MATSSHQISRHRIRLGKSLKGFVLSLGGGWGRMEFTHSLSVYFVLRWRMEKLTVTFILSLPDFCEYSLTDKKIGGKDRSIRKKGEYLWCLLVLRKKKNCLFRKLKVTGSEFILSISERAVKDQDHSFSMVIFLVVSFCIHFFCY